MAGLDVYDEQILNTIHGLVEACGGNSKSFDGELITQQIQNCLKLLSDGYNTGQLKLITRALKEMRYAYRIFGKYPSSHRISIFGSARTPEDHPDYAAAKSFSKALSLQGWMCITGAAYGIMKAGMEAVHPDQSFGLSIRLPFEATNDSFIEGDPKLIHFRYFFTRKLMFMSHSDAIAVFPGGYGTLDELFEILTLMQTGKGAILPVVLMEGVGGVYWQHWENYVVKNLQGNGWVGPNDGRFYYIAPTVEAGVQHVLQFYRRYHSNRYVNNDLVIRMSSPLTEEQLDELNREFSALVKTGAMRLSGALPEEVEFRELPRLVFHHTRNNFSTLRMLIDKINSF